MLVVDDVIDTVRVSDYSAVPAQGWLKSFSVREDQGVVSLNKISRNDKTPSGVRVENPRVLFIAVPRRFLIHNNLLLGIGGEVAAACAATEKRGGEYQPDYVCLAHL